MLFQMVFFSLEGIIMMIVCLYLFDLFTLGMILQFLMMVRMRMLMIFFSPMMMWDSKGLEQPFNDKEEDDCANEYEWYYLAVSILILVCIRKDMDDCVSDNSSTAKWIKHIHKDHEGLRRDERANADQE